MYGLAGLEKIASTDVVESGFKPSALMRPPAPKKTPLPPTKPKPPSFNVGETQQDATIDPTTPLTVASSASPVSPTVPSPPPPTTTIETTTPPPPPPQQQQSPSGGEVMSSRAVMAELMVPDAYNPSIPNDFEVIVKQRELQRRAEEIERFTKESRALAEDRDGPHHMGGIGSSGDEAYMRRAQYGMDLDEPAPRDDESSRKRVKKENIAEKLMASMGWKGHGHGIGKQGQGMATPLHAMKTGDRSGVIVPDCEQPKKNLKVFRGTPSRVLLLQNMVGPGEVDDELEGEVSEECSRFGAVERCLIFEVTDGSAPPDKAVRIFILFHTLESAKKAYVDLDGRFFGGRTVSCSFFPLTRFNATDLAPAAGES